MDKKYPLLDMDSSKLMAICVFQLSMILKTNNLILKFVLRFEFGAIFFGAFKQPHTNLDLRAICDNEFLEKKHLWAKSTNFMMKVFKSFQKVPI
jgi:hypothetical protein